MDMLFQSSLEFFPKPGKGTVVQTITPEKEGRVKYQASYWPARLYGESRWVQADLDQSVIVLGREGITLLIQLDDTKAVGDQQ